MAAGGSGVAGSPVALGGCAGVRKAGGGEGGRGGGGVSGCRQGCKRTRHPALAPGLHTATQDRQGQCTTNVCLLPSPPPPTDTPISLPLLPVSSTYDGKTAHTHHDCGVAKAGGPLEGMRSLTVHVPACCGHCSQAHNHRNARVSEVDHFQKDGRQDAPLHAGQSLHTKGTDQALNVDLGTLLNTTDL